MALLLTLLVVVDATPVTAGRGGRPIATLSAGVELVERGETRGGWAPVAIDGDVTLAGFVRSDRLGCRAGSSVELQPIGREPSIPVRLRRGAMLRRLRERGDLLEVATVGPLVLKGAIPTTACVVPGEPYFDETPREGDLRLLSQEAALHDAPAGQGTRVRLPAGTRFLVRETREGWAGGRTDGPVIVEGWIPTGAIGGPPEGSPLDILTRPLDHTHEVLATARLESRGPRGRPGPVEVRGGAGVDVLETVDARVRVRTVGPVAVEGWLPAEMVREVTTSEESIDLPRGAAKRTPPRRGPRLIVP
ncbi:MAG: hypothetical protein HYY06_25810 [Deltaproteobacteria bacterium]|nr:hypothetical protein [Deltaproteobacteria bacterium]